MSNPTYINKLGSTVIKGNFFNDDAVDSSGNIVSLASSQFKRDVYVNGDLLLGKETATPTEYTDANGNTINTIVYSTTGGNLTVNLQGQTFMVTPTIIKYLSTLSDDITTLLNSKRDVADTNFDTLTLNNVNVATQNYVNSQINNIVSSAPEALNTLSELAQALGNDPNFATTITNMIGSKTTLSAVQANNNTWTGTNTFDTSLPTSILMPSNINDLTTKMYVDNTFLSKSDANSNYLNKTDASNNYLSKVDASNNYLTITNATNNYLTQTNATENYLSKTEAGNVYLTITNASNTYLTQDNATENYLSKTEATNNYLTITNASNTYLTQTNASNTYLTQTTASDNYLSKTDANTDFLKKSDATNTYLSISNALSTYGGLSSNNAWTGTNTFNSSLPTTTLTPNQPNQFITKSYADSTYTTSGNVVGANNDWTGTNTFNSYLPTSTLTPTSANQLITKNMRMIHF